MDDNVEWNGVRGRLHVGTTMIYFKADGGLSAEQQWPLTSLSRVMVSRRNPMQIRVAFVTDGDQTTSDVTFLSTTSRDSFISSVSKPAAVKKELVELPVVSHSNSEKSDISAILSEPALRGMVHVIEAINQLVVAATLQQRPITEQMEADILRQIPTLAKLYDGRVTSEAERVDFWEQVVRRFFCMSRTALPEIPRSGEVEAEPAQLTASVNRASATALPMTGQRTVKRPRDGEDIFDEEELQQLVGASEQRSEAGNLFMRHQSFWKTRVTVSKKTSAEQVRGHKSPAEPLRVLPKIFAIPESAKNDEVLRLLRTRWTSGLSKKIVDDINKVLLLLPPGSVWENTLKAAVL